MERPVKGSAVAPAVSLEPPHPLVTESLVTVALREDLGQAGDITTNAVVPDEASARASIVCREPGRVAGLFMAKRVLERLDPGIDFEVIVPEGADADEGRPIARVFGKARAILTGERIALNFLGRLSGIATATRDLKAAIGKTPPELVGTRKTTPGLRAIEKYAVVAGGGGRHRFGLYDAVLVKDNHIALAGGIRPAVERVRAGVGRLVKIQVEVDRIDQLEELLPLSVDAVLLDNMSPEELRQAVRLCAGRLLTEASGGITPENARAIAETGVDQISVGALTKSARAIDVALDVE